MCQMMCVRKVWSTSWIAFWSFLAVRKDPKEIWDESELMDEVADDIDDGRETPE